MEREAFREHAHRVVDWIADYLDQIERYPVQSRVTPGEIRLALSASAPEQSQPFEEIFSDFISTILPGMTHWQHPSFFAYFPANSSPPSLLAEFLISALGAQCMSWNTSPAATELEEQMVEWMKELLQLPSEWSGVIQPSVTIAGLCSFVAAREAATMGQTNLLGLKNSPQFVSYCSAEAHSSVDKLVRVAGLGHDYLRKIPVDRSLAMDPDELRLAIDRDLEAGFKPLFVVATLGTTSTGAVDPIAAIAEVCSAYKVWLHLDAAYLGSAMMLPEFRNTISGLEKVDSLAFNPNKWMLTNFECTLHFIKDKRRLIDALSLSPEYLKATADDEVTNYRDWGIALGRRFQSLKLWFVLRSYGAEGIRAILRKHIELGVYFAQQVESAPDFELVCEPSLNIVCFRFHPQTTPTVSEATLDDYNETLLQLVNATGEVLLSHTRVEGKFTLRFVPAQTTVELRHVVRAWELLSTTARQELVHD